MNTEQTQVLSNDKKPNSKPYILDTTENGQSHSLILTRSSYLIYFTLGKVIKKRKSFHKPARSNEIYIRREKIFVIYLKRAIKLFNEG